VWLPAIKASQRIKLKVFFKIPVEKPSQCCHKLPPKAHLIDSANLLEDLPPQEGQIKSRGPIVRLAREE